MARGAGNSPSPLKETMSENLANAITPLQAYAFEAHELFTAFVNAGFSEGEAWDLLIRQLPEWDFPAPMSDYNLDDEEDEEDAND